MNPMLLDTSYYWRVITHLGSASLMLPILAISVISLWQSGQRMAVRIWLFTLTLAVMITLATKIAFLGWGLGIASLDFTGISGHTLLATSVLPILFGWLLAGNRQRLVHTGAIIGLLIGAVVGTSRVVLAVHSISEVAVAWLAGLFITGVTLSTLESSTQRPWPARLAPLVLLLAFNTTTSSYLPAHDWEIRIALLLSGRHVPYTRQHLIAFVDRARSG